MSVPSRSEAYGKLMHHLAEAQEAAAVLMHLQQAEANSPGKVGPGRVLAMGWFHVSENLKKMQAIVTSLAAGKLH